MLDGGDLLAWNLSSRFLLLPIERMPGYIQQQLVVSAGFVALLFADTGIVNCAVLPHFFSDVQLKIGFFLLSDQTLNGKTKAYCMLRTIYCYRPLRVSVFICREAAEALKNLCCGFV